MKNRSPQQHLLIGTFIIVIGVLFLIENLDFFHVRHILAFWPTMFIVFGVFKMSQAKAQSGYVLGGIFVLLGAIMTLSHLNIIYFSLRDWWPIFMIGAGVMIIFRDKTRINIGCNEVSDSDAGNIDIVAVMSGHQSNITAQNFLGGEITAVMGGVELDLRNASIQTDAVINVFAFWGGIVLKVPNDWTVINNGTAIMGGIENSSMPVMNSAKRLIITGTAIMGGVEIKN